MTAPIAGPAAAASRASGPSRAGGSAPGRSGGPDRSTHVRSGPRPPAVRRGLKTVAAIGVLVVGYAVVAAVVSRPTGHGYLDITSPDPHGTRALAEILRARGVEVSAGETVAAPGDATAPSGRRTVLVTNPDILSQADLDGLVAQTRAGSDVVLAVPDPSVVRALRLPVTEGEPDDGDEETMPRCALPEAGAAGASTIGDSVTFAAPDPDDPDGDDPDGDGGDGGDGGGGSGGGSGSGSGSGADTARAEFCYGTSGAARLAVLTPTRSDVISGLTGRLVLLGGTGFLTNDDLDETGNAALALGLLARHPRVDWVTPVVAADDPVGGRSAADLLPRAFWFAMLQVLAVLAVLALWRGRRLGPVVPEPLPVLVRSTETVEGRGRLYSSAHARERAAEALRAGLRVRLADRLGLPTTSPTVPLTTPPRPPMPPPPPPPGTAPPGWGTPGWGTWAGAPPAGGGGLAGPRAHGPDPAALVASVAEQTGRSPGEIWSLLYGSDMAHPGYPVTAGSGVPGPVRYGDPTPRPASGPPAGTRPEGGRAAAGDLALVRLARELDELDRQVGRR